jgi:hypothetical protein
VGSIALSGCGEDIGGVELSWAFHDRDLGTVFPRGDHRDSCRFVGREGESPRTYDLNVRLTVQGPCVEGEAPEDCEIVARESFGCTRYRGYLPDVPTAAEPYLMTVDVLVNPAGAPPFAALPTCVAVPGPRTRTVRAGHVTDLAVYQLIVDATRFGQGEDLDGRLDLEACAP